MMMTARLRPRSSRDAVDRPYRPATPGPWTPVIIAVVVAACGTDGGSSTATVTDSAGVRIVASAAPAWDRTDAWTVAGSPDPAIGEPATSPAEEFSRIRRVYSLGDGTIVVANASRPVELRLFDARGTHLRTIGREGAGPGELRAIWDVWIARPDTIVVFDPGLSRVSYFDPMGTLLESSNFAQGASNVAWLPWSRFEDGTFLMRRNVFIENVGGGTGRSVAPSVRGTAAGVVVDTIGIFPETDYYTRPSGNPGAVRFGKRAVLYVSGSSYFRGLGDTFTIDEYDPTGRHVRSLRRNLQPRPITDEIKGRLMEYELANAQPGRESAVRAAWDEQPVAETFPAFGEAWIMDSDGNLWVQNFASPVDPQPAWTVFGQDGRWLGEVAFPDGFTPHEIGHDYALGVFRDQLDVETVRRYEVTKAR